MGLKYVSALEDNQCANPKCKEELMKAIQAAVPKSSIWKLVGVLLVPIIIGFGAVYSLVTTADVKYAKEVEVKVLGAQMQFMTTTLRELKDSLGKMDTSVNTKLEEIQKNQVEVYKQMNKMHQGSSSNSTSRYVKE